MDANTFEIYCLADDFGKKFERIMKDSSKRRINRKSAMPDSEVITILVMFHLKHFRQLKAFYTQIYCREDFLHTVSYNRFVELQ